MKVEVVTPEEYTGGIIGDLTIRRGQVQGQDSRGNAIVINAFVPLANMFGYINNLRSMSRAGRTSTMQFDPLRAGSAEHLVTRSRRNTHNRVAGKPRPTHHRRAGLTPPSDKD